MCNTSCFYQKLLPFLSHLNDDDLNLVQFAIGRYILLGDARQYNKVVSQIYIPEKKNLFLKDVKSLINNDVTPNAIRRAVFYSICSRVPWVYSANKFGVDLQDILFCWEGLDEKTKKKVRSAAKIRATDCLSKAQMDKLVLSLIPHCKRTAYKRLRFIQDSDAAISLEDIWQELLLHAIRTINTYDYFIKDGQPDIAKIKNHAQRSVTNFAINMAIKSVVPTRARIANITQACGECESCKAGKPNKCERTVPQYETTTLSLDGDNGISLYNSLSSEEKHCILDRDYISKIQKSLPEDVSKFVSIIIEDGSSEFDCWLDSNCHISTEEILPNYYKLGNYVMQFLGLQQEKLHAIQLPA